MHKYTRLLSGLILFILSSQALPDPWFTGPLLAPSGKTIPLGHFNLETYGFYTQNLGMFNRHWKLIHTSSNYNIQLNPLLSYGLADNVDVQFSLPYVFNHNMGQSGKHIGDVSALIGYQALAQKSILHPDLRITLQEIFPTGRYNDLNPTESGTDGTGIGSYQTALAFNFQHLSMLGNQYYLRKRMSVNFLYANETKIRGLSSFGGGAGTWGHIKPGNLMSFDLAGELSITKNWVLVMEGYYFYRDATSFSGRRGIKPDGTPADIGHGVIEEITLAPAVEYNFSPQYGIIAGCWFSVKGREAPDFISTVIALNAYW